MFSSVLFGVEAKSRESWQLGMSSWIIKIQCGGKKKIQCGLDKQCRIFSSS